MSGVVVALLVAQSTALLVLLARLLPGYRRTPPVAPLPDGIADTSVTVLVPSLDEARRIGKCLDGLVRQGLPMTEAIVVDSRSTDGTQAIVSAYAARDSRIRLATDLPLPDGWVGKVWALQYGLSLATGEWVLGMDADTEAEPGLVAAVVNAARSRGLDVVSFSPLFDGQSNGERWLQPSMLITLVYRFGAPDEHARADRVMANGQCFLARRAVLLRHGGYELARRSFADDVSLARALALRGERVGFLDGRRLYRVRSYESAREMWREWGRSFDLTDAARAGSQLWDVLLIVLTQGLPVPVLSAWLLLTGGTAAAGVFGAWIWLNLALLVVRLLLSFAIAGTFARRGAAFWLSPLSDPLAAVRLVLSSLRRPRQWRGRTYST
ncbi:MAG: hypothetical protein MNPFHGCM_01668 [Gemmatimonadaceae bacterium]|nr:hypothetical protein [Gemmatimonadaceae bacterium]